VAIEVGSILKKGGAISAAMGAIKAINAAKLALDTDPRFLWTK